MTSYGLYTLSLYCDNQTVDEFFSLPIKPGQHSWGDMPVVFEHRQQRRCKQLAKEAGWKFYKDGRHLCPRCAKGKVRLPKKVDDLTKP